MENEVGQTPYFSVMLRSLLLVYEYLGQNPSNIQDTGIVLYVSAEHVDLKRFFNSTIYDELQGRRSLVRKLSFHVEYASAWC